MHSTGPCLKSPRKGTRQNPGQKVTARKPAKHPAPGWEALHVPEKGRRRLAQLGISSGASANWMGFKLLEYGLDALDRGKIAVVDPLAQMEREAAMEGRAE